MSSLSQTKKNVDVNDFVLVNWGDLYAEESRDVIVKVTLAPGPDAESKTVSVPHAYKERSYFDSFKLLQHDRAEEKSVSENEKEEEEDLDSDLYPPKIKIESEPLQKSKNETHDEKESTTTTVPCILTLEQMQQIAKTALPCTLSSSFLVTKWERHYCLARDGDEFTAFLHLMKHQQRTLLVVQSTTGEVFGGYADSPWESCHENGQWGGSYYGSAQACLFQILKEQRKKDCDNKNTANTTTIKNEDVDATITTKTSSKATSEEEKMDVVKVYKWTGINRYIQLCNSQRKIIAFGGGNTSSSSSTKSSFGLILENDFQRGYTSYCDTFGNKPLCKTSDDGKEDDDQYFNILNMECWGFSKSLDFS